jgi:hypothetical protein
VSQVIFRLQAGAVSPLSVAGPDIEYNARWQTNVIGHVTSFART